MNEVLIYWLLKQQGATRGYVLTVEEWQELIPYSDKEMEKQFKEYLDSK